MTEERSEQLKSILSLEHFQEINCLVKQKEAEKVHKKEEIKERKKSIDVALLKLNEIYKLFFDVTKEQKKISKSLYKIPDSPFLTTLELDEKTLHVKEVAITPNDRLVEREGADLTKRPLQGNLTNKLKEYTRGKVGGKSQPFVVQSLKEGAVQEKKEISNKNNIEKEKATKNPLRALEIGGVKAFEENILLMNPPQHSSSSSLNMTNVTKKELIGIDFYDIYKFCGERYDLSEDDNENEILDTNRLDFTEYSNEAQGKTMIPLNEWGSNHSFVLKDDDSLFGSDFTDSEDEEDSLASEEGDEEDKEMQENNNKEDENNDENNELILDDDEIDQFLDIKSYDRSKKVIKSLSSRGNSKINENSKTWAITKLIKIPNDDFQAILPNPAITYPFELDTFQKQAVLRLEKNQSVFLSAHTSAGKTVVAEYAISLSLKHCTRAIYTSPIKALSNQKYRDFIKKFGESNVGLITGDVQINPDSTCLVMTTEILRSMLYRGADLIRDVEWVIFDEVHYINDLDRGVVWEEVIIMLPDYVSFVFLSATTPNTMDFSDWIGRTKRKNVYVITTDYRPVPLSHYLFAGNDLHLIKEGRGSYLEKGWYEAKQALLSLGELKTQQQKKAGKSVPPPKQSTGSSNHAWQVVGNKQNWLSLVKYLDREFLTPTVVFLFSKKKCEEVAQMLKSLDLNTAMERNATKHFTQQTLFKLSTSDAALPQVQTVCEMVVRGIGVHHGGLLPILKEMVEILFSRNLIKVLFATETFAMGVNMPARAVVFNSIRKHDGLKFRVLQPGEYTQMAGRAGRRGLDNVGTVILTCFGEEPPPSLILKNMLTGSSHALTSRFRLTYNMILNLLRTEDMTVEGMMKRSFSEFQTQRALVKDQFPKLLKRGLKTLKKLDDQLVASRDTRLVDMEGVDDVLEYFQTCQELIQANLLIYRYLLSKSTTAEGVFAPGRVLIVTAARKRGIVAAPALLLKPPILRETPAESVTTTSDHKPAVCFILFPKDEVVPQSEKYKPGELNYIGKINHRSYGIFEISMEEIILACSIKYKIDVKSLYVESSSKPSSTTSIYNPFSNVKSLGGSGRLIENDPFANFVPRGKKDSFDKGKTTGKSISYSSKYSQLAVQVMGYLLEAEKKEVLEGLPLLHFSDCVKGDGDAAFQFRPTFEQIENLQIIFRSFSSHGHSKAIKHYAAIERKETLLKRVQYLEHKLSNQALSLFPDFMQRKKLLKTLGYIDREETVCLKGRVACEVNTCEELIVTEMIFEGILNDLKPEEIVATLSALVFQEKTSDGDALSEELPDALLDCCHTMKEISVKLGFMQQNHGITIDPYEYSSSNLKFGLVHVVYEWARGVPFKNISELTLVQEGSIVRCIVRLDELCRDVRNCSRVVGNPTLYRKMEDASVLIKRDIVFATSLYVS